MSAKRTVEERLSQLLLQKQELLRISAEQGLELSIKEVVSTEEDLLDIQNDLLETANTLRENQLNISQLTNIAEDAALLDTTNFITVTEIAAYLAQSESAARPTAAYQLRESLSDLSEAAFENANAQNHQVLNSLRINYDNPLYLERPSRFNTFNNFSIRIGLRLPLPGNNNFRSSRALVEWREDQQAAERIAETLTTQRIRQRLHLAKLVGLHQQCSDHEQRSLTVRLLSDAALRPTLTAKELTDMEIIQQKLRLRRIEVAADLTQAYLQLLLLDGKMNAAERRNWLSRVGEGW